MPSQQHGDHMTSRTRLIGLSLFAVLTACGPTTSLRNDTKATVYVDFIKKDAGRSPSAQKVAPGNLMTAPWPPADASTLYVGNDPAKLQSFIVATLCDVSKPNCDIRASQLATLNRDVR